MKTLKIMMIVIGTASALHNAQAEMVTAYQCESRCVAVDFEKNIFQILNFTQSEKYLNEQDAWSELNQNCEAMGNGVNWKGIATSGLLVKNEIFDVESDRTHSSDEDQSSYSSSDSEGSSYSSVDVYRGKTKIKMNPFRAKIKMDPSMSSSNHSSTLNQSSSSSSSYSFHFYEHNNLKIKLDMETRSHACKPYQVSEYEIIPEYHGKSKVGG